MTIAIILAISLSILYRTTSTAAMIDRFLLVFSHLLLIYLVTTITGIVVVVVVVVVFVLVVVDVPTVMITYVCK